MSAATGNEKAQLDAKILELARWGKTIYTISKELKYKRTEVEDVLRAFTQRTQLNSPQNPTHYATNPAATPSNPQGVLRSPQETRGSSTATGQTINPTQYATNPATGLTPDQIAAGKAVTKRTSVEVDLSPHSQKVQLSPLMWFYYDCLRGKSIREADKKLSFPKLQLIFTIKGARNGLGPTRNLLSEFAMRKVFLSS